MTSKDLVRQYKARHRQYAKTPDDQVLIHILRESPWYREVLDDLAVALPKAEVAERKRALSEEIPDVARMGFGGSFFELFMPNWAAKMFAERMARYAQAAVSIQTMTEAQLKAFIAEEQRTEREEHAEARKFISKLNLINEANVIMDANLAGRPLAQYVKDLERTSEMLFETGKAEAVEKAKMRLQQLEREQAEHLGAVTNRYAEEQQTIKTVAQNERDSDEIARDALAGVAVRGVLMKQQIAIINEITDWENLRLSATSPIQLRLYTQEIEAREAELVSVRKAIEKVSGG